MAAEFCANDVQITVIVDIFQINISKEICPCDLFERECRCPHRSFEKLSHCRPKVGCINNVRPTVSVQISASHVFEIGRYHESGMSE